MNCYFKIGQNQAYIIAMMMRNNTLLLNVSTFKIFC